MVCAQSNMAVDWISEKLVDRGVPVLRIGNPIRVNDKCLLLPMNAVLKAIPIIRNYGVSESNTRALRTFAQRSGT